jgi:thermitase
MKPRLILTAGFAVLFSLGMASTPAYIEGELLVQVRPEFRQRTFLIHASVGATTLGDVQQLGIQRVKLPTGVSTQRAMAMYRRNRMVLRVERNVRPSPRLNVNDTMFSQQYSLQQMRVPLAWDLTQGTSAVVVAILDDGVSTTHPDLQGKLVPGWDFVSNDGDPNPVGGDTHGTHVAGIAGAATNNGVGIAGVGFNCRIMPIRVFGSDGGSLFSSIQSVMFAADNGAHVINMSYGFPFLVESELHQQATDYAWGKGVLLLGAAGNDNSSQIDVPNSDRFVVAVGATNPQDQKWQWSNHGDWVDLAAPGENVLSTVSSGGYQAFSGTSMSCPNAAGVAALLFAYGDSDVTNQDVLDALRTTAVFKGSWVKHGRIDALAALGEIDRPIPETFEPVAISAYQGNHIAGSVLDVLHLNQQYYQVGGVMTGTIGATAGAQVTIGFPRPTTGLRRANLVINARGHRLATNMVWLWNYQTQKWEFIRSFPLRPEGTPAVVQLGRNIDRFVQNSEMRMITRAHVPRRQAHLVGSNLRYDIDLIRLDTTFSSR